MKDLDLNQVRSFVMVAKYLSFTEAAEALNLSQPAVSAHVKALEKELNVRLVRRSARKVSLTEEGQALYEYGTRMLDLEDAVRRKISAEKESLITIAASTIPSSYLLPSVLTGFRSEHENCLFQVMQSDSQGAITQVLDGVAGLGFVGKKPENSSALIAEPVCSDEILLVTPADNYYMKLHHTNPDLMTLLKEPIILREKGSGTIHNLELYLKKQGVPEASLHTVARSNDLEAIKKMIIGGMGISVMSRCSVENLIRSGQVITYPLGTASARTFYLIRKKTCSLSANEQAFTAFLKEKLKDGIR